MAEQKLLVKREGDFHYPIYFEKDFSFFLRLLQLRDFRIEKSALLQTVM